jgi:hypothetical protein
VVTASGPNSVRKVFHVLRSHHKDIWGNGGIVIWGSGDQFHAFTVTILEESEWSVSRSGQFSPERKPPAVVGEWRMGSRARMETTLFPCRVSNPNTVHLDGVHCHVCVVTIEGLGVGELDLLTACTHHSELQAFTKLSLISTLYKSLYFKSFLCLLCLQQ